MFYQIFVLPQVKRCVIITYKQGTYEFFNELINKLIKQIGKYQKPHGMMAQRQAPHQNESQHQQKTLEK